MTPRRDSRFRSGVGAAALAAALLWAASPLAAQDEPAVELRMEGENGLWVGEQDDRVQVRWITRESGPGFLEARAGAKVIHDTITSSGYAHLAEFGRPPESRVVLRYGSSVDEADAHETVVYLDPPDRRPPRFDDVDSIFVVGDVHGEFDRLLVLLRNAGVIDDDGRWSAGRAHLVLLGDLMGRGTYVTPLLWYVYALEREAEAAGGMLHVVLGNHEIMAMLNDLRYTTPRELHVAELHGMAYSQLFNVRHSILGRWLATKPALLQINDVLMAHGGVSNEFRRYTLQSVDDSVAAFMGEELFYRWADETAVIQITEDALLRREEFFFGENSIFWHRGYVLQDDLDRMLGRVLRRFRSRLHVVAHTPGERVRERYGGRLIAVHPPLPALELLLLVRDGRDHRRYRFGLTGPPVPVEPL